MVSMDYKVLLYKDENNQFIAECVELPGCISDGKTKEEAILNVKEAILAYSESVVKEANENHPKAELIKIKM
jgi:predicted RNase H-like HicB family nuclease